MVNNLSMKSSFKYQSFLDANRAAQHQKPTHKAWGGDVTGNFYIPQKKLNDLLKLQKQYVNSNNESNLFQLPQEYSHLVCDFDFKVSSERWDSEFEKQRLYTTDILNIIVSNYREAIQHYLKVNKNKLQVFLLEKDEPTIGDSGVVKDGFHLEFPFICAGTPLRHLIRKHALESLKKCDEFKNYDNKLEDIFDESVVSRNPWPLYGSVKPNGGKKYGLTKIMNVDDTEESLTKYDFDDLLDMLSYLKTDNSKEEVPVYAKNINDELIDEEYQKIKPKSIKTNTNDVVLDVTGKEEQIVRAKMLMSMLSIDRTREYYDWLYVGFALYNTSPSLLDCWVKFSKQDKKKFKKGECEKRWKNDFKNQPEGSGYTIRSLEYWAKCDNYDLYTEFKNNEINTKVSQSLSAHDDELGEAIYTYYKDKFVCASLKSNEWYEYKNHRWVPSNADIPCSLYTGMANEFANIYHRLSIEFHTKAVESSGEDRNTYETKADLVNNIHKKLKKSNFRGETMKRELKNRFYIEKFEDKLDQNKYLLCFNNGIYDLERGVFRDGQPEDYLSISTNIDFVEYDENNNILKEIQTFFRQILPKDSTREFLLTLLASCIDGHTVEEKFFILNGCGSNGKSVLIDLFTKSMGDYATSLQNQIITKKRGASNQASPDLYAMKGRRSGFFQETDSEDKMYVGQLKEYTGGDMIQCRKLFGDMITFKPQITLFLICNVLPKVDDNGHGTWRRLRVVNFLSKFVEGTPDTAKSEFKIDKKLKQKLTYWAPVFIGLLVHYYNTVYKKKGLQEPEEVLGETNKFKAESDRLLEFIDEEYQRTKNKTDRVPFKNIWKSFRDWWKNNYPNEKSTNRAAFKRYLTTLLDEPTKRGEFMYLKRYDDEDEEEEIIDENDDLDN
jgi:P4 family phage/plasmid primase-like protien